MPTSLDALEFLKATKGIPVFDVRSEGEFFKGHIPGAISLPLFNNAERAEVGTLYKQNGRNDAVLRGLEIVGPKMGLLARTALNYAKDNRVAVHCWRGGMRSGSIAWLFERVGLEVMVLRRGYKGFRRLCLEEFTRPRKLLIVGGRTGSRKTQILHELANRGAETIDLEAFANHRGSAFGYAADGSQPTQEQFEDDLGYALAISPAGQTLILEDESRLIGRLHIPDPFWKQMRAADVCVLEWSVAERVQHLVGIYDAPDKVIAANLKAIEKRLGGERTRNALEALTEGRRDTLCEIVLDYYDHTYDHGLSKRDPSTISRIPGNDAVQEILKRI